jgi:DNA invertase Pin-like site-specific DNA recombinase
MADFIAYYRVSTSTQAQSGLGLEAQKRDVLGFINGNGNRLVAEFTEVESGKRCDRPQLNNALNHCRETGAKLLIARLDRLARNAAFLLTIRDSGVEFIAADMPDANRLTVGIMALVAEDEAERISQRTKAALVAAKARGVKLGGIRSWEAVNTSILRRVSAAEQHAASGPRFRPDP